MLASTGAPQPDSKTAGQILGEMSETYKICKTYSDSGSVRTTFLFPLIGMWTTVRPFTTAFVRPDRFRFEFTENYMGSHQPIRYIVWQQGQNVKTWWDNESHVREEPSLNLAVAGATGVSGGSAFNIPSLLLPTEIRGHGFRELKQIVRLKDTECDETRCFLIRGRDSIDDIVTLWIDSTNLLIRRIHSGHDFGIFSTEEDTTYINPAIDRPIPDQMLAFSTPPEQ